MSKKGKVKVGIIGSQFQAQCHLEAFRMAPYEAEVVAVASPTPGHAKRLAEKYRIPRIFTDYKQMLAENDIEMITITAPNYLHAQMTIDCANAGKHVVCEKPLCMTLEEADLMIETCEGKGVLLMYAEALNEIHTGPTTEAYNAINEVRNRAGLDDLTEGLDYQPFKDAVLQERQWEFVMEGQRWYDLIRMGKLTERILLAKPTANVQSFHILFPIPQQERYYNTKLTQNTGYN